MKHYLKIVVLIALIFVVGCQYDPYADDLTIRKPKFQDVLGTYIFEQQTVGRKLDKQIEKTAKIILKPDSTFEFINVPNFEGIFEFRYKGVLFMKGKWHLEIVGGVANGTGKADDEWGMRLDSVPQNLSSIGFMQNNPPYKLIITYGDPDVGAVMIFSKKP